MNYLVRLIVNDDGDPPPNDHWHLGSFVGGSNSLLCTGEVYNDEGGIAAEGAAFAESKATKRGGVNCPECLSIIKSIKGYKF